MAATTVKNELHYWPQPPIFSDSSSQSPQSLNHWQQQQQMEQQQQHQAPSPLSDYYFQMLQPEEDIISMSSLDVSGFQSGLTDDDEEQQQQQVFSSGFPAPIFTPFQQQNVLLEHVVRSKLESIETELLSDEPEPPDSTDPDPTSSFTSLICPESNQNHLHHQQQLQQQEMIVTPPAPTIQAGFPAPSVDFRHRAVPPMYRQVPALPPGGEPQVLLVHLLVLCADAIARENLALAAVILARLRPLCNPSGTPMQRLATYVSEALAARAESRRAVPPGTPSSPCSSLFRGLISSDQLLESDGTTRASMLEAFSAFYDFLPIGKFDHLTMNQVILDAVERDRAIHILDLQLWFGTQWPALLQALATRPGGPPRVRITAVGKSSHDLQATKVKLQDLARSLRVSLEVHVLPLANLVDGFEARLVELRPGEAFVVNSLSQFHYLLSPAGGGSCVDPDSRFSRFMREVRSLRPKVLVMAENDANHNSPEFLRRFSECLKYYSAVFDAMATCASSPAGRLKMERLFAAPKIRNIVACEENDRVERHESMADWSRRLQSAGFTPLPLSQRAINQARLLLRLYYTDGYTLVSERGYLVLGWRTLPLNTVSAWRLG